MATKAHCAFCFETLSAHFERRQALSLAQVEALWQEFPANAEGNRLAGEEEQDEDAADVEGEDSVDNTDGEVAGTARPAAVSRLLNRDNSATSSSSSLPSTRSTASSTSSQRRETRTPASSTSSSNRSLSSMLGSKQQQREAYPLFVTWNIISRSGSKSLRGCIGTFEAQDLELGLKSYALTSAFEDARFQPIPATLLSSLSNHVTLLTDFSQSSREPLDWTLGKHGIRISFTSHSRRLGATYLPDVAKEQGWTKEETMVSLMRKAGWNGSSGSWMKTWREGRGELITYEGKQVGLSYDEWREWREWVDKEGMKSQALK